MSARVFSVSDIARQVGGEVIGDGSLTIHAVRNVGTAREGDIAVAGDRRNGLAELQTSGASALIVPRELAPPGRTVIVVDKPREALVTVLRLFEDPAASSGVHPGAVVAESASVAPSTFVGPGAVIGERTSIGERAQIHANVVIGDGVAIGADSVLYPGVVLYANTRVGDRVVIHSGTVIGSDGFGYRRLPSGEQEKIPHFGRVVIEDDVEIGANCAIDRATIEETRVGRGTKIDNLVQIGHNSQIGSHACILGQVGISGSVKIGNFSILAGQAGVADHVTLGEGTVVGAQAGVHHDLSGGRWLNTPAIPAERAGRIYPIVEHLPEYRERIRTLERRCQELERKLEQLIAELTAAQRP